MFSGHNVTYNSSVEWVSYIHPHQALLLCLFTDDRPYEEHIAKIAQKYHFSHDDAHKMFDGYVENENPFHTEYQGQAVLFPKNVLITYKPEKTFPTYNIQPKDLSVDVPSINLTPDRCHRSPQYLLFMLTRRCLTSCGYCYANTQHPCIELSTEEILHIIEEAERLRISYIDIIGGELFCKKDWDIILKTLVEKGMSPTFISTKIPITEKIVNQLKATGYHNVVQLSLDALTDGQMSNIIHSPKGYVEKVKRGIEWLVREGFQVQIDTILTKYNCSESDMVQMYEYAASIPNLAYWEVRVPECSLYTPQTFQDLQASRADIESACRFVRQAIIPKANIRIVVSDETLHQGWHKHKTEETCFPGGSCGMLTVRAFILPDGKVGSCEQLYWHPAFVVGDLRKQTLEEAWNSPKAKKFFDIKPQDLTDGSCCKQCKSNRQCFAQKRRCYVKIVKAYGSKNWQQADPRCIYSPKFENCLIYK